MEVQFNDYHSEKIEIKESEYYPIYDYISSMYFKKYITSDMSYDQCIALTDKLVERITFDVPEEYNIDTNHFYENLNNYCESIGIETTKLSR